MVNATLIEALSSRLALYIAIVVRPSPYRKLFFIPIFCFNIWLLLYVPVPGESPQMARIRGSTLIGHIFIASDFILLTDVQNELRLQNDKRNIPYASLRERMLWAVQLMTTTRGIGWVHEPTARIRPRPKNISRWAFVFSKLSWVACCYILNDLLQIPLQWNLAVVKGEAGQMGWLFARATFLVYPAEAYLGLNMAYDALAAVTVSLGLTKARDWPAIFGYLGDAYTVRRFWGRVWHQHTRRYLTAHGKFISKEIFHLKSGTSLAWHVHLYAVFALSGLVHISADYRGLGDWTKGGSMRFCVLQAVAITFEGIVTNLASRIGYGKTTRLSKLVGYMWVLGWFIWALPGWSRPWAMIRIDEGDDKQSSVLRVCQKVLGDRSWRF